MSKNWAECRRFAPLPLSFGGEDDMEYGYKLGVILSFMQKHARMISGDPSLTGRRYLRYYNRFIPEMIDKEDTCKAGGSFACDKHS
ncbi:MAG: hypothetical protein MZV63_37780 [Marinilabiliales bacterium]|nr:hypothetical protein [Marinilabiliales bacterium]